MPFDLKKIEKTINFKTTKAITPIDPKTKTGHNNSDLEAGGSPSPSEGE